MAGEKGRKPLEPFAYAVNFLSYRPRSYKEVADALKKRGVSAEKREEVLGRLQELKLVDDAAFAESWIYFRTGAANPKGRLGVTRELQQKGVAPEVIEAAMAEYYTSEMEDDLLDGILAKEKEKLRQISAEKRAMELKKLVNRLAYRGFALGVIYRACADLKTAYLDSEID